MQPDKPTIQSVVNSEQKEHKPKERFDPVCERKMVVCEKCGCEVAEHNLKHHTRRAHSEKAEVLRRAAELEVIANRARKSLLREIITCTICGKKIRLGEIKSHFGEKHHLPTPTHYLLMLGEKPPSNRFKSDRAREHYWRSVELGTNNTTAPSSEDLFDRTKVLQGGAFGLGKNRRN